MSLDLMYESKDKNNTNFESLLPSNFLSFRRTNETLRVGFVVDLSLGLQAEDRHFTRPVELFNY